MSVTGPAIVAPASYNTLRFRHIKVSHVPESSPTPTPVILITLSRPNKYNAFTDIMREDLERVYELINIDERVKVAVLTGDGRGFCAGADLEIGFLGGKNEDGSIQHAKSERDVDHRDG